MRRRDRALTAAGFQTRTLRAEGPAQAPRPALQPAACLARPRKEHRVLPRDPQSLARREFQRILLIKLSAVGDVVHTIALLNALRRRYPAARIDWLAKPSVAGLIRHHPSLSSVIVYGENHTEAPRYNWDGVTHFLGLIADTRFLAMLRQIRSARYDLVVDVHGQMRTGFVTRLTGAGVRLGFGRPRREVWEASGRVLPPGTVERSWKGAREGSWLAYTHHIPLPTLDIHAIDRYLGAADLLGAPQAPADCAFPIPPAAEARVAALLGEAGLAPATKPVLLAPAALWETKRWREEGFAEVARRLVAGGRAVVLVGASDERAECGRIAAAAPGAVDLSGRTSLIELAALIRRSALCLTNDSGPMHMAVALGRPVVAVFGPTNPAWIGPYRRDGAVLRSARACVPCNLRRLARCPHDHACMREVTADQVLARIETALASG